MQSFDIEQAIFASSERGSVKGYQLVARSPGIDRAISQCLCRWAPTKLPSDDPEDWVINYFPIDDQLVAITRTIRGGPEYSRRGGFQVVTLILVLTNEQFQAYRCNPILVTKTALALGLLRLPLNLDCDQLPLAKLPVQPLVLPAERRLSRVGDPDAESEHALLDNVAEMVNSAKRIALIGADNPIPLLEDLIGKLSFEARRAFSFTTGLAPTVRRPFQAHFLANADLARQRTLDAQNIKRIELVKA
jgi:hypothetical protein